MSETIPSSDTPQTIDILADVGRAASIFVAVCSEHLTATSIVGHLRQVGFSEELLHILKSVIPTLAIYCQTSFKATRELGLKNPAITLIRDVQEIFTQHQKTVEYLEMIRRFPTQAFIAAHTYFATSNLGERPLHEILTIQSQHRGLHEAINANLERAILQHAVAHLQANGIPCSIKPCRHGARNAVFLEQEHPRQTVDAIMASHFGQRKEPVSWYYLLGEQQELQGHPHQTVDAIFFS